MESSTASQDTRIEGQLRQDRPLCVGRCRPHGPRRARRMFRAAVRSVPEHPRLLGCVLSLVLSFCAGSEVDLDLGNYERYLALTLAGDNNITTGKIYQHVCIFSCNSTLPAI